ncbi:unnamed protein product [Rangifer tarandus platyrhynchus]|uniref:Uncharacterized protein n=2 Tax=Rangifer tarandus platyrhynchus TaxID=3082113 RepID=A0ABN8ZT60_RANTA|nr:unnamed protein product [Rangifer tarandus platyrhynchus]
MVKSLPAMQETWVHSLGGEDPLEKGMAAHSIILVCRILWTEEPGGYSPWGHKELDVTEQLTLLKLFSKWKTFFLGALRSILYPSVQFSSVAQSYPTLCDPMNRRTPGLPVHHQLLEFTQTHVHRVSDAIQPSHPLSSPSPPVLNLSQHQGLFR